MVVAGADPETVELDTGTTSRETLVPLKVFGDWFFFDEGEVANVEPTALLLNDHVEAPMTAPVAFMDPLVNGPCLGRHAVAVVSRDIDVIGLIVVFDGWAGIDWLHVRMPRVRPVVSVYRMSFECTERRYEKPAIEVLQSSYPETRIIVSTAWGATILRSEW